MNSIFWDEGISDLGKIQFSLSAQAVPTFLVGLYSYNRKTDVHPWIMSVSALVASGYIFGIYFGYQKPTADSAPFNAGITAFCLQIVLFILFESLRRLVGIGSSNSTANKIKQDVEQEQNQLSTKDNSQNTGEIELLYPGRPEWDVPKLHRFGDHPLTPELTWKSMEGINEPLANPWWCFLMFFTISLSTPLTAALEPPMDMSDSGNIFLYPPATVRGLPWWAFKAILLNLIPTFLLLGAIFKMPNQFPADEKKIEKEGIDVDVVEMTQEELGRRASYDEQNALIHRRRSSISITMEGLGLAASQRSLLETTPPTPSHRKLLALATKSSRRVIAGVSEHSIMFEKVVEGDGSSEVEDVEDVGGQNAKDDGEKVMPDVTDNDGAPAPPPTPKPETSAGLSPIG
jgi:hypothetical protein